MVESAHHGGLGNQPFYGEARSRVYTESELARALQDPPQAHSGHAFTLDQSAHLMAITCSPVPTRHDHWIVRLLVDQAVELGFVVSISPETIRKMLKK